MTPAWLTRYVDRGFRLVFYPTKTKGPTGTAAVGWTERSDSADTYTDGDNVGTFTGHEIKPGRFLVDVDFDWTDGLQLARRILPKTGFGFGRSSRQLSHAFYTTSLPQVSKEYTDIDGKGFVELRGTKVDGSVGLQTMLPPSVHPTGEVVELRMNADITHDDTVPHRVLMYAIACMLFQHLGQRGLLHDTRLAVAGFLLGEGMSESDVITIGEAVAEASGNNVADVAVTVGSTAARIKNGDRVFGKGALAKALGDDGKKVISRIRDWLGGGEFVTDDKDHILANNQENIKRALDKLDVHLSFDEFAQRLIIDYNGTVGPLSDALCNHLWFEIDKTFKFRPQKDFYFDFLQYLAHQNTFHPVLDYLRSLKWDGVERLDQWLITAGGAQDTEYCRAVSSLVLLAACRRVTTPGCKFDEMLVLESGQQGIEKSTALRTLCPKDEWFSDDLPLNVDAKQIVERTLGKWIIEASDLSGMHKSAVEHLKGMLSRQVDGPVRMAYARVPVEQKRSFILIGTTNSHAYLTDGTGNRRFWPLRIEKLNVRWIRENRDQLWAEAFVREQAGESIRLSPSLYEFAGMQQERRRTEDAWEQDLAIAFHEEFQRVAPDEIWETLCIPTERRSEAASRRVTQIMQLLGFRKMTVQDRKGRVVKGWGRGQSQRGLLPTTGGLTGGSEVES